MNVDDMPRAGSRDGVTARERTAGADDDER